MSFLLLSDGSRIILGDGDGFLRTGNAIDAVTPAEQRIALADSRASHRTIQFAASRISSRTVAPN